MAKATVLLCVLIFLFVQYSLQVPQRNLRRPPRRWYHAPPPLERERSSRAVSDFQYIQQRVDNFNPQDNRTWSMRYLFNDEFWVEGGPIFIFIGGEWTIDDSYLSRGLMYDAAQQNNAYMFYTEHRYYGESYPTPDMSTENLQYLTTDQALADLANFIVDRKANVPGLADSRVIVVGGSYGGNLATWARLKYPHLIHAAHASSAPVRAKTDFFEYLEVVGDSISEVSRLCYDILLNATWDVAYTLDNEDGGLDLITRDFNLCEPLSREGNDIGYFWSGVTDLFSGIVQYAQPGDIEFTCEFLLQEPVDPYANLVDFYNWYYGSDYSDCGADYATFVDYYSDVSFTSSHNDGLRQWFYQTCTEYGYFQTLDSSRQPFGNGFGLPLYISICGDLYGDQFRNTVDHAVQRTNTVYGSLTPDIHNIVFVHGSVDPWHALGILASISEDAPAIYVQGSSHCADLSSISAYDSDQLRDAKQAVLDYIAQWVAN